MKSPSFKGKGKNAARAYVLSKPNPLRISDTYRLGANSRSNGYTSHRKPGNIRPAKCERILSVLIRLDVSIKGRFRVMEGSQYIAHRVVLVGVQGMQRLQLLSMMLNDPSIVEEFLYECFAGLVKSASGAVCLC